MSNDGQHMSVKSSRMCTNRTCSLLPIIDPNETLLVPPIPDETLSNVAGQAYHDAGHAASVSLGIERQTDSRVFPLAAFTNRVPL
jgi:hypothetical protein